MKYKKIFFKNKEGIDLSARIDFPIQKNYKAFVLFAHCFTCSKNFKSVDNISDALVHEGFAVFRFDFTGLGQSEGDFSDSNFSSNLSDLKSAYAFLEEKYTAPQILIGHSLGGAAVLHVAGQLPEVKAVATVGAPADPLHVRHLFKGNEEELESNGEAEVNIGGRPFTIKKQFIDDLEKGRKEDVLGKLDRALLIMHAPQDRIVGIDNATDIYTKAMHPKSFVTLDGADHLLTREGDAKYVGLMVSAWSSRYVDAMQPELQPEGEVKVRIGSRGYTTEITAGSHCLVADEPASAGGQDLGPSPYGYLLSALGTCTAMTLRMYADFKKLDLQEVEVYLTHDKVHHDDGENSEKPGGKIDKIVREIRLEGDLTGDQRKRLIEIADRCPVHKTLESKPIIKTKEWSD